MKLSSLQKGLVLNMDLDSSHYNPATKRFTDKTPHSNHGTSHNAASFTTDRMGQANRAMTFNGTSDYVDAGNGDSLQMSAFIKVSESPDVDVHQGVTTDGTYFYLFDTGHIKKVDRNWNQVAINTNVNSECGNSHLGDGCYYDGKLYVATNNWAGCINYLPSKISVWDASDLSFIETHDISAQGFEDSSLVVDGGDNIIYLSSYCDGTKIWKYSLTDFSYISYILLSETLSYPQGIAKKGDYFYISITNGKIYKVALDGTIIEIVYTGINEGIDYTQNSLYGLNDPGDIETIYELKPNDNTNITVAFWINIPYLPSEIPEAYMRFIWTTDDKFVVFYKKTLARLEFLLTTFEGSDQRATVAESELYKNQCMHITAVYNRDFALLYVNSCLKDAVKRDETCLKSNWNWYIGSTAYTINGSIADVRIYNRALSQEEITLLYDSYRPGVTI